LPVNNDLDKVMQDLVARGMRVQLGTASLITGGRPLMLGIFPGAPPAPLAKHHDTYIMPVMEDGSGDLAGSASALIARLNAVPFEQIGNNLNQALAGVNGLANDPQLKQAIATLQATLASTQALMANLNRGVDPLLARMPSIAASLEDAVKRADHLVGSAETGYGANSQFNREVARLLVQLSDTARSVRVLADLLSRHPEALIRGRTDQGSP
jgi:paraquat-inducible protein B